MAQFAACEELHEDTKKRSKHKEDLLLAFVLSSCLRVSAAFLVAASPRRVLGGLCG
jgi:hypothetical protein